MALARINGRSIWFEKRGRGPNLLLIHGFPLDHRIWAGQVQELSRLAAVYVPDLPGFGRSPDAGPFAIESLAEDLHGLMAEIGALPCVPCGLSMGGYVSLAMAAKYPADLAGLILVDTRAEADAPQIKQGRDKMIALARAGGTPAVTDAMLPRLIAQDASPDVIRRLKSIMLSCPALTIEHALAAMRDRRDYTGLLAELAIAVDVIVGEKDVISPVSTAQAMASALKRGRLTVIPGAGHLTPLEKPAEAAAAIAAAMKRF